MRMIRFKEKIKKTIKIKIKTHRLIKKMFLDSTTVSCFCFGATLVALLSVFCSFSFSTPFENIKNPKLTQNIIDNTKNQRNSYFSKKIESESPDLCIIEKNSLRAATAPIIYTPQVFGSIIGSSDFDEKNTRDEVIEYIIKEGDNLSTIATKFNISLNTLLWVNNIGKNSPIKIGQKLMILPISGILHSIKNGDNLSSIAKTYKVNVDEIVSFNELSNTKDIFIGDMLIVPNGKMPTKISNIALIPVADNQFIFPCEGKITQGLHFKNAVDIANKCGKPVVAAASGTIQRAGIIRIGGKRVTILHQNGVGTYYGHLSTILVTPGQQVNTGDIIGYIGNTGYTLGATGCHVHFEVIGARNFLGDTNKYPVGSYVSWKK